MLAGLVPLVYVTMGTVFNNHGFFPALVQAVAGLGVRVLVTVGPQGDPGALGEQPARVRVETFVPQTRASIARMPATDEVAGVFEQLALC